MLRLMLTCHPDFVIPPESLFISNLYPLWGNTRLEYSEQISSLCDDLYKDEKFCEWNLERRTLEELLTTKLPLNYNNFVDIVYSAYVRKNSPLAIRWGDKNPSYVLSLDLLWQLFPQAKVIHIVRDGRAVLNSFRSANRRANKKIWPETVKSAAYFWLSRLRASRKYQGNPNYMEIFYEKLVQDPDRELQQLCSFLDLAFDPVMLDFAKVNRREKLVPTHRLAWHGSTLKSIQKSKIDEWQHKLDPIDVMQFEMLAGYYLTKYGYLLRSSKLGQFNVVNRITWHSTSLMKKIVAIRNFKNF